VGTALLIDAVIEVGIVTWHWHQAHDPNELTGTTGTGTLHAIAPGSRLMYTAFFENDEHATAAAQFVRVHMKMAPELDLSTLQVESINVAGNDANLSSVGTGSFVTGSVTVPLNGGTTVAVASLLDPETGELDVTFAGPPNFDDPQNPSPYADFLP